MTSVVALNSTKHPNAVGIAGKIIHTCYTSALSNEVTDLKLDVAGSLTLIRAGPDSRVQSRYKNVTKVNACYCGGRNKHKQ
jgi:hypothetical protein